MNGRAITDVHQEAGGVQGRRRFTVDVDSAVLAQLGEHAVAAAFEKLAEYVVQSQRGELERVVHDLLLDRAWAEDKIKAAITEVVERVMREMFQQPAGG